MEMNNFDEMCSYIMAEILDMGVDVPSKYVVAMMGYVTALWTEHQKEIKAIKNSIEV